MEVKYSPSVNIIRDSGKVLHYIVTPNAERVAHQIANDFKTGIHSFNLIGSYGTGKSSFLWALEQSLQGNTSFFDVKLTSNKGNVRFLNFVGEYQSIINAFSERLGVSNKLAGNQEIFDAIYQEYEKAGTKEGLLVVIVDEFGKFLEYAAKHEPEKELYFIQQLAEFTNDSNRNILFISTLHQSFESYSNALTDAQRKEWVKVKGRLKELTFNEPVEQLLLLAGEHFAKKYNGKKELHTCHAFASLNKQYKVFSVNDEFAEKVGKDIYPLELFSAYALTLALQQYGQNERSLFTFLESNDHLGIDGWEAGKAPYYHLADVYDYLYYNFYSFLNTKYNPQYTQWVGIRSAIQRTEAVIDSDLPEALQLVKTIGLLSLFAGKAAKLDRHFFEHYSKLSWGGNSTGILLDVLEKRRIIRFNKYSQSYKLTEGTDLDIDAALLHAGSKVDEVTDVVQALNENFDLPYLTAKAISYLKGTPRNFAFIVSDEPTSKVPKDEIDGYINLIFNEQMTESKLMNHSAKNEEAILFGFYKNAKQIKELLFEIEKTEKVLGDNQEDNVAKKELKTILAHQRNLLNHFVLDNLYSDKIVWFFHGQPKTVNSKKQFNQLLSAICKKVYDKAPIYRNELVNKHKIPSNIHTARKLYFEALVKNWNKKDLGFDDSKFPPEKTIYLTLLKQNGIQRKTKDGFELSEPEKSSSFNDTWMVCETFLGNAKHERKKVTDLVGQLSKRPFKLKQGLIDFWVPTFLFIKRGDYTLYEKDVFVPYINEVKLYEIARNPQHYEIKTFEITGIRLKLFNKYREFLQQEQKDELKNFYFIESIRPFMIFYKNLPDYCKKTQRLSAEAMALRNAMVNAQDPEKIFFEDFPGALKLNEELLANSDEALAEFARILNDAVNEIKNAYSELLSRIEQYIQEEIIGEKIDFAAYKRQLEKRFASIKEHQLLPQQKTFIQRINSPIDDCDSWIASIGQAVLQKPLNHINDNEEQILKDRLLHLVRELDNLRDIQQMGTTDNEIIKFDLTTGQGILKTNFIEIPKGKTKELQELSGEIDKLLKKHQNISTAVLAKLLEEYLNNEQD